MLTYTPSASPNRASTGADETFRSSALRDLPAQPAALIGREGDLAAAGQALLRPDVRLLTLTGPAGVGKTRLALALATAVRDSFADGVGLVDLTTVAESGLVATAIGAALELRHAGHGTLPTALRVALGPKRLLLVLDNFEHVLEAAPLVADLLATCPHLKVLATSREALRLRWEHEYPVAPLALPDMDHLSPDSLERIPAVALFLQRSRAAQPDLALNADNARAVAELCHRLDGLPLAIELAAARSKVLSPAALLARLERRLDVLTRGGRDVPPRHRTLRGAIDWSYSLLTGEEQRLFRALGAFAGGCTLEAVEVVVSAGGGAVVIGGAAPGGSAFDALDVLTSLVDKNLVRRAPGVDGEDRFEMLETIREYARERLAANGETDAVERRHAAHFGRFAARAEAYLRGAEQAMWLTRLETEHANLRAALRWYVERGRDGDAEASANGLRLGGALWRFWWVRAHITEARQWLAALLALPEGPAAAASTRERAALRAEVAFGAGIHTWLAGDLAEARRLFQESLGLWRTAGDEAGVTFALENVGEAAWQSGDYPAARNALEESVRSFRHLRDDAGLPWPLSTLGLVMHEQGDSATGQKLLEESAALFRAAGERFGLAQATQFLGVLADDRGSPTDARSHFEAAVAIQRDLGDRVGLTLTLECLAALAARPDPGPSGADTQPSLSQGAASGLRAVRLAAAASAQRETVGVGFFPSLHARVERRLASVREAHGEPELAAAWAEGRAMTLEDALAAALMPADAAPPDSSYAARSQSAPDQVTGVLSERERQVAALVARGLTNRQIAHALSITPGTAGNHILHILSKLGLRNRAQIAAWAVERGLSSPDM